MQTFTLAPQGIARILRYIAIRMFLLVAGTFLLFLLGAWVLYGYQGLTWSTLLSIAVVTTLLASVFIKKLKAEKERLTHYQLFIAPDHIKGGYQGEENTIIISDIGEIIKSPFGDYLILSHDRTQTLSIPCPLHPQHAEQLLHAIVPIQTVHKGDRIIKG